MTRPVPMYAPAGGMPVYVQPGQVETMKNRGWSLTPTDDTPPVLTKQEMKKAAAKKAKKARKKPAGKKPAVTAATDEGAADDA